MMSITAEYRETIESRASQALRSVIHEHPNTSAAELRALLDEHPSLGTLTLAGLLGAGEAEAAPAARRRGRPPKAKAKAQAQAKQAKQPKPQAKPPSAASPKRGDGKRWDTRTEEGRAALDREVINALAAFGGVNVRAEAIRARVGATPAQIRTSLARHIEAGAVSYTGQARGTQYSLEG